MKKVSKMTVGQLIDVRDATQAKLDTLKARKPSKRAEVNEGFDRVADDLTEQIAELDAEIARRV